MIGYVYDLVVVRVDVLNNMIDILVLVVVIVGFKIFIKFVD